MELAVGGAQELYHIMVYLFPDMPSLLFSLKLTLITHHLSLKLSPPPRCIMVCLSPAPHSSPTVDYYKVYPPGVYFINASLDLWGYTFILGRVYARHGDI